MEVNKYITKNIYRNFKWGVWDSFQFVIEFLKENRDDANIALELENFFNTFKKPYHNYASIMELLEYEEFDSLEKILGKYFDKDPMMTQMQQRAYYNDGDIAIVPIPKNITLNPQPKKVVSTFQHVSYYHDYHKFYWILGLFNGDFVHFLTENHGFGLIEAEKCLGVWKVKKPPSFYREARHLEKVPDND